MNGKPQSIQFTSVNSQVRFKIVESNETTNKIMDPFH